MAWNVEFLPETEKSLTKLGRQAHERILKFMRRVAASENPRSVGEPLKGSRLGGLWRYRCGDYRIICDILDTRIVIVVVLVGHRREVYK